VTKILFILIKGIHTEIKLCANAPSKILKCRKITTFYKTKYFSQEPEKLDVGADEKPGLFMWPNWRCGGPKPCIPVTDLFSLVISSGH
jgi:hypothetical protein